MLKRIFTSNARIKLLTVFINNEDKEFFIRELTRLLDEQINSIRRELDNLKKAGILRAKVKNRKKYYYVNKGCIIFEELKSIIKKCTIQDINFVKEIEKLGNIQMLILSGIFVEKDDAMVDMLLVGNVDKEKLTNYLNNEIHTRRPVKFATMSESDFNYRLNCKDKFITEIINDPENQIPIKKIAI